MADISRRMFFGSAAAALPFGMIAGAPAAGASTAGVHADTIVTGGKLLTMDKNLPVAQAMAIRGEYILAIGSGGTYALAASRALMKHAPDLTAREIVEQGLEIAADICVYTNHSRTIMEIRAT